jgi:hypothetical protein
VDKVDAVIIPHRRQQVAGVLLRQGVPANVGHREALGSVKLAHLAGDEAQPLPAAILLAALKQQLEA